MWTELFADLTDPRSPRRMFHGAVALALITALLAALSMVYTQQVRAAQLRDASLQIRRAAISDCVQYARYASLDSCTRRVAGGSPGFAPAQAPDSTPAR